jgi:hypothetical protein
MSKKIKKGKRKGLKVHSSPKLNEQLKGDLRKKIELSLIRYCLLLLLGLLVKNFAVTLKQGRYRVHLLGYMGFGSRITFA